MEALEATLHDLEATLLRTAVRNRPEAVADLLADDFLEFGSSGSVWTKAAVIADLAEEPPTERRMTDFQAHLLAPGVALVTYRVERPEEPEVRPTLRSSIWVLEGERWQMRFHQGTPSDAPRIM